MLRFLGFIIVVGFVSCIKKTETPSWIEVKAWQLETNPTLSNSEGELTHSLSNAWIYVDDELLGVFQVPCKIPVLKSGNVNIKIFPTVLNNGISATKKIYPFLNVFETNLELIKSQTTVIQPITSYKNNLQFWIEDFEDANLKIVNDNQSTASLTVGNVDSLLQWGNYYGQVNLNSLDSNWIAYTNQHLNLPKGEEVYLEMDYCNTNSLITGLIAVSNVGLKNNINIQLNKQKLPQLEWKKIYIDLKELISYSNNADFFELSFLTKFDAIEPNGFILIDNIKIIHF